MTRPLTSLAQLPSVLEKIAEQEEPFTERFYEIFFELRPDSLPLFGVHSISEREEMMRETLRSLYAWSEAETWLGDYLDALGRSHAKYGVTSDMYDSYSFFFYAVVVGAIMRSLLLYYVILLLLIFCFPLCCRLRRKSL